jgi:hypothetical protein
MVILGGVLGGEAGEGAFRWPRSSHKTAGKLNRERDLLPKPSAVRAEARATGAVLAVATAGLLASACSNMQQARRLEQLPVEVSSPAAQAILEKSRLPGRYPSFQEIPPVPDDVRPGEGWRQAVAETKAGVTELQAEAAANPPTLFDSDAWAARGAAAATPPPPPEQQSTEDYARELRERATPPPRPK